MPLDLNNFELDSLSAEIHRLPHGQALLTSDGLVVRKRQTSPGFDCGVGRSGVAARHFNTAEEAADFTLTESAKHLHPLSLGGNNRFEDFETAKESIRSGKSETPGPSPAIPAIKQVSSKATVGSYRIRAQKARNFLNKGDISRAVRQIEAIIDHASDHDNLEDVMRAKEALSKIKEHHDYSPDVPELFHNDIKLVTIGSFHHIYRNGRDVSGPLGRSEAERRFGFISREAAREEDKQAIDNELNGLPNVVARAGSSIS